MQISYNPLSTNNYQIASGLYQHDNTLTIDLKKKFGVYVSDQIFTFKIKTLPTATKIPKSRIVNIFVSKRLKKGKSQKK
jgi:hypothetical protein